MDHRAWRGGTAAVAVVAMVMLSRLVLDEHWATDVLAGAAVGVSAAFLARWCVRRSGRDADEVVAVVTVGSRAR